jgi:transcriptional regulator with XRE-family HTH domain
MATELGAWLRQQRQTRGWSRPEMARRLIAAARETGDNTMPRVDGVAYYVYRWERGLASPSERHRLIYCRAFDIAYAQFGLSPEPLSDATAEGSATGQLARTTARSCDHAADRGIDDRVSSRFLAEQEVLMAAHEGSDHAARAEDHGIGDATLEQLRADLVRLSHESDTGQPLSVFLDLRRVRERVYQLLERRLWPAEQTDLYFSLGVINGLMGLTANRLGYPDPAEELIRSGWAYATAIDHRPLLARYDAAEP